MIASVLLAAVLVTQALVYFRRYAKLQNFAGDGVHTIPLNSLTYLHSDVFWDENRKQNFLQSIPPPPAKTLRAAGIVQPTRSQCTLGMR